MLIAYTLIGSFAFLTLMSFAATKNEWYLSTVYPVLAMLVATGMYSAIVYVHKYVKQKYLKIFYAAISLAIVLL
ncbi:hypothetical protein Q6253_29710, partial [Klebsiella quasipneumoniae]|nr:hypothetical protein [Klebsiella quasipneumoniae]